MQDQDAPPTSAADFATLRQLFDDYLRMYAGRDDRLTTHFSEDFSGFTGGGDFLVKDRTQWVAITRQDFAQVKDAIRIELKDVSIQSLAETIAVATGFFAIHLPIKDHILSRETARLVLIFRKEPAGWKISHSSISIPYHLVREGEVYPLKELVDRNQFLERVVAERTAQLSTANVALQQANAALAREIAEGRQTEQALQISEQRYRSILHASPDDITITDAAGGIIMISPMAYTMFAGAGKGEFMGRPLTDFLVPEDRPRALSQIARKRQGAITGPMEYRGLRVDGTTFDIEVNSEFMRDAAGLPSGMVVIVRDITDRKQAEARRERLEAENRQLQKAESLARMAGAIAHHFNNQLQAVMMSLELATHQRSGRPAGPDEYLTIAMQAARKAAEVSSLMLIYLGQTTTTPERLDLVAVCRACLSEFRSAFPETAAIEATLPSPGPVILADADQIRQMLTNLVTNAREATADARAAIRVSIATVPAAAISPTHRFPVDGQLHDDAYACLEIADSGCGIPDQDLESIFDPFFSRKFPGRGMGLAVVLGIVRAHDGAITVESQPGRGSTFRVYLPTVPISEHSDPQAPGTCT